MAFLNFGKKKEKKQTCCCGSSSAPANEVENTCCGKETEGMGFTVVPFGQGFKDMSPPTKELMKLVLEQKIAHDGHPVLRWNMDNIYIRTDPAGNIKADKEKSTEKIDGAASVYDERGLLFL